MRNVRVEELTREKEVEAQMKRVLWSLLNEELRKEVGDKAREGK